MSDMQYHLGLSRSVGSLVFGGKAPTKKKATTKKITKPIYKLTMPKAYNSSKVEYRNSLNEIRQVAKSLLSKTWIEERQHTYVNIVRIWPNGNVEVLGEMKYPVEYIIRGKPARDSEKPVLWLPHNGRNAYIVNNNGTLGRGL